MKPLLAVVLSVYVAVCSADWQDGNDGVDRLKGDLPGMPISLKTGAAPKDCAQLCYASVQCRAWAFNKPNCNGAPSPQCYLKANVTQQSLNSCRVSGLSGPPQLLPVMFRPLPLGAIKPQGWLKDQLTIQANGLSGHLPLFWADVMNSSWIGGKADGGLHERAPYWLNGFLPLAYQLENQTLIDMAFKYVDYIISHQADDGWLGPDDAKDGNQYWSKYFMMMILRQYHEVNNSDTRVLPAMMKFFQCAYKRLFTTPLGVSWSGARWQDLVLSIHWMLENSPGGQEQMLWDFAELMHEQGFDWKDFYANNFPNDSVTHATLFTHGVNNGQAIKSEGVWYRQSHNETDFHSSYVRVQKLDDYHGQPSGIFACDEHLAGKMPSRGTELCTVVEAMFSFETLFSIQGDPMFAERAEKLTYNALPATITPDMWAHQYLQQVNAMSANHTDPHVWAFDGPDSTVFGLAPNYGCCTANFNQGWPKFAQHLVMEHGSGMGLVVAMYSPAQVEYTLGNGIQAKLSITTDYPFDDTVTIDASCEKGMILSLRIPSWAVQPTVSINGTMENKSPFPDSLYNTFCTWSTKIVLKLPMKIAVERGFNNSASIFRGPLLYGLYIKENKTTLRSYEFESKDYAITPQQGSSWNYALHLSYDPEKSDMEVTVSGLNGVSPPFSQEGAPVKIQAKGHVLNSWVAERNAAAPPPQSPIELKLSKPLETITLIPFGATDLRIAEFPVLDEE